MQNSAKACQFTVVWLLAALLIALGEPGLARDKERYCTWKKAANDDMAADYDALLFLDRHARMKAIAEHMPWGVPTAPTDVTNEVLLVQRHYIINYDIDLLTPTWTAHHLTKKDLENGDVIHDEKGRKRIDVFRSDPRLKSDEQSHCTDYKEPIFDQGHIVPNGDMTRTEAAMVNTFVMSNMAPQHCAFNRGPWQVLEGVVRKWARQKEELYIFTGAVFDRDGNKDRDADGDAWKMLGKDGRRVAIGSHFFKIVLHPLSNGDIETISIQLPNTDQKIPRAQLEQYLTDGITSIDKIEEMTDVSFLPELADLHPDKENSVSQFKATALWPISGSIGSLLDSGCRDDYPDK